MSKPELFPLLEVIEVVCSDDETADEAVDSPIATKSGGTPCLIRRLPWRSTELEDIVVGIDSFRLKVTQSIPKNAHGRPPRPRVRSAEGPYSRIKPPAGLSVDCYSTEWLMTLSPLQRSQLNIQSEPRLASLISIIQNL